MKKKPCLEYEDPLEREISEYFRLPLEAPIEEMDSESWSLELLHLEEQYGVDFDGIEFYVYNVDNWRSEFLPHELPHITVGHLVEVARRKQWFTPDYLKDYLTEEKQIELFVHHFVQSYRDEAVYLHSQVNDANRIFNSNFLYKKLRDVLIYGSVKNIQGFDYKIYFEKGNSLQSRLQGERRVPITVSHIIEVMKHKRWSPPEYKDELEEDIVGFFTGALGTSINIDLAYSRIEWEEISEYLRQNYGVDFTGMNADIFFAGFSTTAHHRDKLPPITVSHLVEVVRLRKWFTPDCLKDYLTEEKQEELSTLHRVQQYLKASVSLNHQLNNANNMWGNSSFYSNLSNMLKAEFVKEYQLFNYHTYFVAGNMLRSRLQGERRIPLTVAHLVEVDKRKQWFDPEFKDDLEKDIVGFFAGLPDNTINIELRYHKDDWSKMRQYLENNYSVDFTGMDADKYFVNKPLIPFCRPKPAKELPPLTVGHMVEVVRRRKWFEPLPAECSKTTCTE